MIRCSMLCPPLNPQSRVSVLGICRPPPAAFLNLHPKCPPLAACPRPLTPVRAPAPGSLSFLGSAVAAFPPHHPPPHHPELGSPPILESFRKPSLTPKSGLPGNWHRSVSPGELTPLTRLLSLMPASRNHDSSLMAKPRPQTPERRCYPAPPHPRTRGLAAPPGAQ